MSSKDQTIILSAILLVSFFIPNVEWDSFEMSGLNFMISSHTPDAKYILLTGPFSALFLLAGAADNKKVAFSRNLLRCTPFFSTAVLLAICYSEVPGTFSLQSIDLGCWIALVASLLLILVKPTAQAPIGYA